MFIPAFLNLTKFSTVLVLGPIVQMIEDLRKFFFPRGSCTSKLTSQLSFDDVDIVNSFYCDSMVMLCEKITLENEPERNRKQEEKVSKERNFCNIK